MPPSLWQRLLSLFRPSPRRQIPSVDDIRAVPGRAPSPSSAAPRAPKPTPEELDRLCAEALKLAARFVRPAFVPRVQTTSPRNTASPLPTAGSRFCGPAALKPGEPWPACSCGKPMQLFLQLNSAELPAAANKPFGDGVLQLFYCTHCDDPGAFSTAHLPRILPLSPDLVLASRPDVPDDPAFPPRIITGWEPPTNDLPNYEELHDLDTPLTDAHIEALGENDHEPLQGEKLLGYPYWVQGVDYPSCPRCNTPMQHLFQIDSEKNIPYMFCDAGIGHLTVCPKHRDVLAFGWSCY